MKKLLIIFLFIPVLLNGQHFSSYQHEHTYTKSYENPLFSKWLSKYDVKFYHLSLEVSNKNTFVQGYTNILLEALEDIDTIVFQLIDPLDVTSVKVNDVDISGFQHNGNAIYIPAVYSAGELISITIYYNGNAGQDRGFFAGITSAFDETNEHWVTYTLSEPLNARDWFPVKQVLTDKADSVWIDLTCDKGLMAGSNGLLQEIADAGSGKHTFKWRSRYPIAYYLISFSVSDYRDYSFYTSLSGGEDSVLVQNYIYDDDEYFNTWKSRIDETGAMISLYSDLVIDYPFSAEKYGHTVAPMGGGMEHQTMTTLSNFNFGLVSHELAHQWFGDNITCANWQDIWINEGFASYFEYLALQNLRTQEEADKWMGRAMDLAFEETGSVFVPEEDVEDVYRVFDYGLSYKKGAALLHMIRYELNSDSLFFKVLKSYSNLYSNGLATAEQFREVLDSISGMDFSSFFDQWYYGNGYPSFNIVWYRKNDTLHIQSLQESSSAETPLFKLTFDIRIKTNEGYRTYRLYQDKQEQSYTIPVSDFILSLEFDPDKHLLAKSSVNLLMPDDKDFAVGPNPCRESVVLKFKYTNGTKQIELFNLEGKRVIQKEIDTYPYELLLTSMPDGPYILVVSDSMGRYKEKLVKISNP